MQNISPPNSFLPSSGSIEASSSSSTVKAKDAIVTHPQTASRSGGRGAHSHDDVMRHYKAYHKRILAGEGKWTVESLMDKFKSKEMYWVGLRKIFECTNTQAIVVVFECSSV